MWSTWRGAEYLQEHQELLKRNGHEPIAVQHEWASDVEHHCLSLLKLQYLQQASLIPSHQVLLQWLTLHAFNRNEKPERLERPFLIDRQAVLHSHAHAKAAAVKEVGGSTMSPSNIAWAGLRPQQPEEAQQACCYDFAI